MDQQQQYCLKWSNYSSNLATAFSNLFNTETLTDVTLFCEGTFADKMREVSAEGCSWGDHTGGRGFESHWIMTQLWLAFLIKIDLFFILKPPLPAVTVNRDRFPSLFHLPFCSRLKLCLYYHLTSVHLLFHSTNLRVNCTPHGYFSQLKVHPQSVLWPHLQRHHWTTLYNGIMIPFLATLKTHLCMAIEIS